MAALLLLSGLGTVAHAGDYVGNVNKDNQSPVDKATVAKIYTGDLKAWKEPTRARSAM